MFSKWFKKPEPAPPAHRPGFFSTDILPPTEPKKRLAAAVANTFQRTIEDFKPIDQSGNTVAMDEVAMDSTNIQAVKRINGGLGLNIPEAQLGFYVSQSFIGYQTAAILSQHWLIDKACTMPARDAARNGYEITVNDGTQIDPDVLDFMKKQDKIYGMPKQTVEFVRKGRIFGIRIAMFLIDSTDPLYYEKPFNPDGIKKNSYRGISQIDPYWITPELDAAAATNPTTQHFYEPTWWRVNGRRIHRTHLIIMRNGDVPDILKPTYLYGGIPVPQKIMERVYAAERTANEAPLLAMTKRLTVINLDLSQAMTNPDEFDQRMQVWVALQNNYGIKVVGGDETIEQFDTSLNDLDMVIMTQYQLVAAGAEVPATKLLGTTPKGFNATGEYEEASYHEMLESIQHQDMSALVERHHLCLIRSEVCPKFNIAPFGTEISWNPVNSPTALELAEINDKKANSAAQYVAMGAIDGEDVRTVLIADKRSGYNGLEGQQALEEPDTLSGESVTK